MTDGLQLTAAAVPDLRERIALEAQTLEAQAQTLRIANAVDYAYAADLLIRIRERRQEWIDYWAPHLEGALKTKRDAEANRKRIVTDIDSRNVPLTASEERVARQMGAYEDAIAIALKAEQARLQLAADQAAADRALAEAAAIEQEALAAETPEDQAALLAEAEAVLDAPARGGTVQVDNQLPKIPGYSRPTRWKAEVYDLALLLQALVSKKLDQPLTEELTTRIHEAVLVPLNQRAVSNKSALRIPGVRAVPEKGHRLR
jgi:hypothetical protein